MSTIAKEAAIPEYIRDNETELLFNHSSRVYHFGALAGIHRNLVFDRELLYAGAMFHDIGLMPRHGSVNERFEVDGAHAARDFLRSQRIPEQDACEVWTATRNIPTRSARQ
jgi:HD superfamily phosphodiesterase